MFEMSHLPVSGGVLLACALYAGASLYAGQIVGTRTIERSGWAQSCEAGLKADIAARNPPKRVLPQTDCQNMLGWLHPDVSTLCRQYGNPDLGGPAARARREAERRRRAFEERKLARAAAGAASRCACAASVYTREHMISLGIYAGTARAISLPPVTGMQGELQAALHAPVCTAPEGGTP